MNTKRALKQLDALYTHGNNEERLAAQHWKEEWQTLISILLSARTRDDVTIPVAEKLFTHYPTLEQIANASQEEIEKTIKSINFFRNKSKNVRMCAKALVENFDGKVPHNVDDMITLPGVGRKTANVFLSEYGYHAIGVDTHVARVSYKLGWTTSRDDPVKIEKELEALFPQEKWSDVNNTLVRFGRNNRGKKEDSILEDIKKI